MKSPLRFLLFSILFFSSVWAHTPSWSGEWHVFWQSGSFSLTLQQQGDEVNGIYQPGSGKVLGKVKGRSLLLHDVTHRQLTQKVTVTLGDTGHTFFGNMADGEWIAAIRAEDDRQFNALKIDQRTPRRTLYSFLKLGNSVRAGDYRAIVKAMALLIYPEEEESRKQRNRFKMATTFFQILDECIVERTLFTQMPDEGNYTVVLKQLGSDVVVPVTFHKSDSDGKWRIVLPSKIDMENMLSALLKARGKYEVAPLDNLKLVHPRATVRTFFEQYNRWEHGGKPYVISTMNLSEIDPSIHEWQAPLLAYYLKSVFDRISEVVYQEIPNDPKSRKPYVFFHHPVGSIVIAPYEKEGRTVWQFTPRTLETIPALYNEMENVPAKVPTRPIAENNLYFSLKSIAKKISPSLLDEVYYTEIWQIILLLFLFVIAVGISFFVKNAVNWGLSHFYLTKRWTKEMKILRYARPAQLTVFAALFLFGAHQLGLSHALFSVIKALTQLLIVIGITWIIYNLVSIFFSMLQIEARKTYTDVDEIIFSLMGSIARITIITGAVFVVAEIFQIPYKTVLAGLGIGGLAFAIAAKDTIANFFGSAIIIADRPFKTGDRIKIGKDIGVITNVGIRSTKIRTTNDTLLTVPNNKITQEMIDNYSARESMRVDTEFLFAIDTPKSLLDKVDVAVFQYLKENPDINHQKIILTGVNDFSRQGIKFDLTFFVNASSLAKYSEIRHRVVTDIAQIIRNHGIKMVTIPVVGEIY
jgi:small-conductance mechanosensitive channel